MTLLRNYNNWEVFKSEDFKTDDFWYYQNLLHLHEEERIIFDSFFKISSNFDNCFKIFPKYPNCNFLRSSFIILKVVTKIYENVWETSRKSFQISG